MGTGHYAHPANILSDASVQVLSAADAARGEPYVTVARFDASGLAVAAATNQEPASVPPPDPVASVRIAVHSHTTHWVLLSQVNDL